MSTVVAVEYLSLDGIMEEPRWSAPYFNEELQDFQLNNLMGSDALLLGRVTYEGFKSSWPVEGKPRIVTGRQRAAFGHSHARLARRRAAGARGRRPVSMPAPHQRGGVTG